LSQDWLLFRGHGRDREIFKATLEPFIVAHITKGFKKQQLDATSITDDLEVEEFPDTVIVPLNQYYK
jgi:hypothetical protein